MSLTLATPHPPTCYPEGKEEKEGDNDNSHGHHFWGTCFVPGSQGSGLHAMPNALSPVALCLSPEAFPASPPAPPHALPLTKHSLDCVVHLGVLVVLGGHQEFLNIPKKPT